jgi:GntR family transcriptional regulator
LDTTFPRQLQRRFEQAVVDGVYVPGVVLDPAALAADLGGSAGQVALVLRAAGRKGLVELSGDTYRLRGLVRPQLSSVFTHTARAGLKPRSEVRAVGVEPATHQAAAKLRLEPGSPIYRFVRTRWVGDLALANQTNYIPYEVCPGLEEDDVSRQSFQRLLEDKYHAVSIAMEEQFELLPASDEDRAILGLPAGAALLRIERIALGATGWPLVWADLHVRPDRYDYVAALWPQAAALLQR